MDTRICIGSKDDDRFAEYLNKALLGSVEAQERIAGAYCNEGAEPSEQDIRCAITWYKHAADGGSVSAGEAISLIKRKFPELFQPKRVTSIECIHEILHRHDATPNQSKQQSDDLQEIDLNIVDNEGETILMKEVRGFNYAAIEMLLEHGVDTEIVNSNDEMAYMLAVEGGWQPIIELMSMYAETSLD
ncbi:MAG: hypothetical protein HN932_01515 [Candidatus Marinimicrobia bacterium]|jgi:TPR repeat protein|nr:hypothetical protein [Candidatus Neomarinimicrobiota bacterium]